MVVCWKCHSETSLPLCQKCGTLQPLPLTLPNLFELLGLEPTLLIDEKKLRQSYLKRTSTLHPDRFASKEGIEKLYALKWTTELNRAFHTLKDPIRRSEYLLELLGVPENKQGDKKLGMPQELAEAYFEMEEDVEAFEEKLQQFILSNQAEWMELAVNWSSDKAKALQQNLNTRRYMESMMQDLKMKQAGAR